jgi:hypothetical protein
VLICKDKSRFDEGSRTLKSWKNMEDTARDAEKKQIAILRRLGPEARLRATIELSRTSRRLLLEGVHRRHPDYDERQIRLEAIRLTLPKELFRAAYPEAGEILA